MRDGFAARRAPRGPELDDIDLLALAGREVHGVALDGLGEGKGPGGIAELGGLDDKRTHQPNGGGEEETKLHVLPFVPAVQTRSPPESSPGCGGSECRGSAARRITAWAQGRRHDQAGGDSKLGTGWQKG